MKIFTPDCPKVIADSPAFSEGAYALASAIFEYSRSDLYQLCQSVKGLPEIEKLFVQALDRGLCIGLWESCLKNNEELRNSKA